MLLELSNQKGCERNVAAMGEEKVCSVLAGEPEEKREI
jgi:hypothetical protein